MPQQKKRKQMTQDQKSELGKLYVEFYRDCMVEVVEKKWGNIVRVKVIHRPPGCTMFVGDEYETSERMLRNVTSEDHERAKDWSTRK